MTLLPAAPGFGTRCKVFSTPKHNDIFRILLSGYYFLKQAEYPSILFREISKYLRTIGIGILNKDQVF
ncbi:hypothetical protein LEP1GSC171_2906 [Leptospira santarosai str. HAI1380]|nr:hypothetical protein LEP1GSC171_2906 [Leptospira santarosai str. HAI1380]